MDKQAQVWVDRIRAGDPEGLRTVVRHYEPALGRLAAGMLRDPGEAAEAVQDAFVLAWRKIATFRDGSDFGAWLSAICMNCCREILRRRARDRRRLAALEPAGPEAPAPGPERAELHRLLLDAVSELPEREREAFLLMAMEGMPSARAAEVLGVTPEAVRSALCRARRALSGRLKGLLDE